MFNTLIFNYNDQLKAPQFSFFVNEDGFKDYGLHQINTEVIRLCIYKTLTANLELTIQGILNYESLNEFLWFLRYKEAVVNYFDNSSIRDAFRLAEQKIELNKTKAIDSHKFDNYSSNGIVFFEDGREVIYLIDTAYSLYLNDPTKSNFSDLVGFLLQIDESKTTNFFNLLLEDKYIIYVSSNFENLNYLFHSKDFLNTLGILVSKISATSPHFNNINAIYKECILDYERVELDRKEIKPSLPPPYEWLLSFSHFFKPSINFIKLLHDSLLPQLEKKLDQKISFDNDTFLYLDNGEKYREFLDPMSNILYYDLFCYFNDPKISENFIQVFFNWYDPTKSNGKIDITHETNFENVEINLIDIYIRD